MKRPAFLVALPLLLLLLTAGCATRLSDAERKAIRSVSVSPQVKMPERPMVTGPEASRTGFVLGPIGLLAAMHSENADVVSFRSLLESNGIDVAALLRGAFVSRLEESKAFASVAAEGAQANIDLTVDRYGLAPGFSMRPVNKPLRPLLVVTGRLTGPGGKVLWEKQAQVYGLTDELAAYPFDEYLGSAERTREQLEHAARIVARELVSDLMGSDPN